MTRKRQTHSEEYRAKAALEAIRNDLTMAQLIVKHSVLQALTNGWKEPRSPTPQKS